MSSRFQLIKSKHDSQNATLANKSRSEVKTRFIKMESSLIYSRNSQLNRKRNASVLSSKMDSTTCKESVLLEQQSNYLGPKMHAIYER